MIGQPTRHGQTFKTRFRWEADEEGYDCLHLDIEAAHYCRMGTWITYADTEARRQRRMPAVKIALIAPDHGTDVLFGSVLRESDIEICCETAQDGHEYLSVQWPESEDACAGLIRVENITLEQFEVMEETVRRLRETEANDGGEKHLCVFCGDEGAKVRTEGFAPECDECAGVSESLATDGKAPEGWQSCRTCGCWELNACVDDEKGPCSWAEDDLCSQCKETSHASD